MGHSDTRLRERAQREAADRLIDDARSLLGDRRLPSHLRASLSKQVDRLDELQGRGAKLEQVESVAAEVRALIDQLTKNSAAKAPSAIPARSVAQPAAHAVSEAPSTAEPVETPALDAAAEPSVASTPGAQAAPGRAPLEIEYTIFRNTSAQQVRRERGPWRSLVEFLKDAPTRPSKEACELLKLATFGEKRTKKGSLRHDANLLELYGIEGDYDAGKVTPAEGAALLQSAGVESLIYTSASHGAKGQRWRVLLPLSRPHPAADHGRLVALLNGALGGILGGESWTRSQSYYFGRVEGVPYECHHGEGLCLDEVVELIGIKPIEKPGAAIATALEPQERTEEAPIGDETVEELRSALAAIPSDERELWVRIGHALKQIEERGLELWLEWSRKSPKFDADDAARVWDSLSGERTGYAAVFAEAQRNGWRNPKAASSPARPEDFPALPTESKSNRFAGERVAEFARRAAPEWLVRNVLPRAELGLVIGESGAGKSFLAFDVAAAIARGEPWHGQRTRRGRVVYVVTEGTAGMRQRALAYGRYHEIRLEDLDVIMVSASPNLMQRNDVAELVAAVQAHGPVTCIVIDTLANSMPGGDENSFEDVSTVLAACRALHRATGALVLVVHHLGKNADRGARGHSSLKAAADVELTVRRSGALRTAAITKIKDGVDGGAYQFRLLDVELGRDADGQPITSCVLQYVQGAERHEREPAGEHQKFVLGVARELLALDAATTVQDVIELAKDKMVWDSTKKDRRRERATAAVQSLVTNGWLIHENDRLRLGAKA